MIRMLKTPEPSTLEWRGGRHFFREISLFDPSCVQVSRHSYPAMIGDTMHE